jgi:hypothetical protein
MSFALSACQTTAACTDEELVAAVREGSDQAFEELYARYHSLSSTRSPVSKVVRHAVSGAGAVVKTTLAPLPRIPQPKVPVVRTPTSPPRLHAAPLPKVRTPSVTTGAPALPKVPAPSPPRLP